MLNYLFIFQIILIIIVLFLYWVTDFSFIIILGIIYLLIVSGLLFFLEVDILICFLIIIDLGVFFIFLSLIIHLLKYLNKKYIFTDSLKNTIFLLINCILIFNVIIFSLNDNMRYNLSYNWFFLLNYINYIASHQLIWLSEMHLFKEIFFNFNSFEFILISILLFIDLLCIFFLYKLVFKITSKIFKSYNMLYSKKTKLNSIYFFKTQNHLSQYRVPATSRVFTKRKHDSKTNSTSNNR